MKLSPKLPHNCILHLFSQLKISMNVRGTMDAVNITVTIPMDLIPAAAILAMD